MQETLLDPKLDLVFKKLFCLPENRSALQKFLNLIFANRDMPLVDDITIQNPQIDGDALQNKSIALDIHAKSSAGESLNIEIQLSNHKGLRSASYFIGVGSTAVSCRPVKIIGNCNGRSRYLYWTLI